MGTQDFKGTLTSSVTPSATANIASGGSGTWKITVLK
jgi:hypothetical protein